MKVDRHLYEKLVDYDLLKESANDTKVRTQSKRAIKRFYDDLENNLISIINKLYNETYEPGPYHKFLIYEPKIRPIETMEIPDRVLQQAIYKLIYSIFEKDCISTSYACQVGKGCHKAAKDVQHAMRVACYHSNGAPIWIIKADVHKFFASIDRDILTKVLYKKFYDNKLFKLLTQFLGDESSTTSIPIGNLLSQVFANFYLGRLDHYLKDQLGVKYYFRYMDDFCIIVNGSRLDAKNLLSKIDNFLINKLKLSLNDKTKILPLHRGVNFLGYMIKVSHMKLRHRTVTYIRRLLERNLGKRLSVIKATNLRASLMSLLSMARWSISNSVCKRFIILAVILGLDIRIKHKSDLRDYIYKLCREITASDIIQYITELSSRTKIKLEIVNIPTDKGVINYA